MDRRPGILAAHGPAHRALNRLAGGYGPLEDPLVAFVARWAGKSFRWAPEDLTYVLDRGSTSVATSYP